MYTFYLKKTRIPKNSMVKKVTSHYSPSLKPLPPTNNHIENPVGNPILSISLLVQDFLGPVGIFRAC